MRLSRASVWLPVIVCSYTLLNGAPGKAGALSSIRRIYVGTFGGKPGAEALRAGIIAELRKSRRVTLADDPGKADAVLSGSGEIWIRGYYSLNPRLRETQYAHPIYGGYLSVELTSRGETLWSYLVTPSRYGPDDMGRNLGSQIARKLSEALQ